MNKKITVIISVSVFILISLIVSISLFNSRPQTDSANDQSILPTTSPVNRRYSKIYNNGTKEELDVTSRFNNFLPYDTDALSIDYSPIANSIYIEKKNDKADEELKKFLELHGLTELFIKNPALFKTVLTNVKEWMNEDEEVLSEDLFNMPELTPFPTTTPNPNDPSRDVEPMINVFKSLMGFNINLLPPSSPMQISTQTQSSQQSTASAGIVSGAQIGSYKIRVKYDWKEPVHPICVLQPGTSTLVTYLQKTFGSSASFGIRAECKTIPSMHSDGRAVDYSFLARDPEKLKRGNEVFAWLLTNVQNIGIQYIKYWRLQWSPSTGVHCVTNTPYPANKDDMYAHSNHIHFELNLAGAHKETPFFTRGTSLPAAMVINQEICPQLDPRMK